MTINHTSFRDNLTKIRKAVPFQGAVNTKSFTILLILLLNINVTAFFLSSFHKGNLLFAKKRESHNKKGEAICTYLLICIQHQPVCKQVSYTPQEIWISVAATLGLKA